MQSNLVQEFFSILRKKEQENEQKFLVKAKHPSLVHPESFDRMMILLGVYGLVSVEDTTKQKPEYLDFEPLFEIELTFDRPVVKDVITNTLAAITGIDNKELDMEPIGDSKFITSTDMSRCEYDETEDYQKLVGDKRVDNMVSDFLKDLSEFRKKMLDPQEISNKIDKADGKVVEAKVLNVMVETEHRFKNGYYVVESSGNEMGRIIGPFDECPYNYEFHCNVDPFVITKSSPRGRSKTLHEYTINFVQKPIMESVSDDVTMYRIVLKDAEDDHEYPLIVESPDKKTAIEKAKNIMEVRSDTNCEDLHIISVEVI